jgi:hypothetical protein
MQCTVQVYPGTVVQYLYGGITRQVSSICRHAIPGPGWYLVQYQWCGEILLNYFYLVPGSVAHTHNTQCLFIAQHLFATR